MVKKMINKKITSRSAAADVVQQVLEDGAYTNIAVNKFLRSAALPEQERRFFTELVYGTVKAAGTIDWFLSKCITRPLHKIDSKILNILRVSAFQIIYLDRIPDSAACNEAVNIAKQCSNEGAAKFVNGVLRGLIRKLPEIEYPDCNDAPADHIALKYCHPRWLVKKWLKQFGFDETVALCRFDNTPSVLSVRVNTLKSSRQEMLDKLQKLGIEAVPSQWSTDGILCDKLIALNDVFSNYGNSIYIQDESSMLVADILDPQENETIIDMCSAPGGKTTHIAQKMHDRGKIIAGDIHEHKIRLIEENAKRLGITIIDAKVRDASVLDESLLGIADRVLVDAPCSGLGVLRRRAEARWRKRRQDLKVFPPLQLQILNNAAQYVKETGIIVYSTCTIEQAENHYVISEFLKEHPQWEYAKIKHPLTGELFDELQFLPQKDGIDGFYICALRRKAKV